MHGGCVVPHHQITHLPLMGVDIFPLRRVLHQIQQEHPAFGQCHALNLTGVDTHKKNLAARARIGLNQWPYCGRNGLALIIGVLGVA